MSFSNFLSTTKGKITIVAILSIIIISGLIYYFMYGSLDAKYTRQSKKIISLVESSASNATTIYPLLDNDPKNIEKTINIIKSSSEDIDKAIKISKEITAPDKFKSIQENLKQGLQKNKLLYTQTIAALENYSSTTVSGSINKLYEYLSLTLGYYEGYRVNDLIISLPSEFINYPDKIKSYIESLNALDNSIKTQEENNTYIASIKESLTQLNNIKSLVEEDLKLVNDGRLTSKQLMVNISKHKNTLSSVIDNVNSTPSPSVLSDVKTSFITCSVSYEDYLTTLRGFLESSKESDSKLILSNAINNSSDKFKLFDDNYIALDNLLKEKQSQ